MYLIYLGFNLIHGTVLAGLGNLENLTRLSLDNNNFKGNVNESISKLQRLQGLQLDGNKFSGKITYVLF
uniref:Phytosulfokine receptor n=1 Tax=Solanum tuberosum TaxID=4113 RepID=M1A617_SOLTU